MRTANSSSHRVSSGLAHGLVDWTISPVRSGISALTMSDRGCCFTFHRVARRHEWRSKPNRGFYVDLTYLENLLTHLLRNDWDVVTISEAVRRATTAGKVRRFVNFSVDDCYRDTAELVSPLFQRLSAPITLFVTTGIPDKLIRLRDAGLETILERQTECRENDIVFSLRTIEEKRTAYANIAGRWDHSTDPDHLYTDFCARHGYDPDALDEQHRITWAMLQTLACDPHVEIGGHTVLHRRIAALEEADAMAELAGCRNRLQTKLGIPIEHFAFPFGRSKDCGERDFHLAQQAGFRSASTTRKGLLSKGSDAFQLNRNTLNGNHRRLPYAYAHLSGLSGYLAQVTGRG